MSYQVLARKWRPGSFAEVAGQEHVLQALGNALENERLHHAYLLTGTRGVGKTTIARILARCLNCETGITANPCGECGSCREISEGRSIDLLEIDAASRTKVENMRELLENVPYAPSHSRYKIYLIDEVHMLSNHSFNALLKTLEEPPPHVIFLFATTDPQKIPATVLSRCLQFHLRSLDNDTIVERLQSVFDAEEIKYEEAALLALANAAAGSMRDALSLADQAIGYAEGEITQDCVVGMLGSVGPEFVCQLLQAVFDLDGQTSLRLVREYGDKAMDFASLFNEMTRLLHRIAIEQVVPGAGRGGQLSGDFIRAAAEQLDPADVQLFYQVLLSGKRDLPLAPDPLGAVEMALVRMLAFTRGEGAVVADAASLSATPPAVREASEKPGAGAAKKKTAESASAKPVVAEAMGDGAPSLNELNASRWCEIFSSVPLSGVVRTVASHCVVKSVVDNKVQLQLDNSNATLYDPAQVEKLGAGLAIYYGQPVDVEIALEAPGAESPAEYRARNRAEQRDTALQSLNEDENVRAILETFDGAIDQQTVEPLSGS